MGLQLLDLLREARRRPIIYINQITPTKYFEYILSIPKRGDFYLSNSAYGKRRSALSHCFRAHNRMGFPQEFNMEIGNLFQGFFREIIEHNNRQRVGGGTLNDNAPFSNIEGKEAMLVVLYKKLLEWFLAYGTVDGVFAHTYLVLTWNLACRVGNTSRILFCDITWSNTFDSFSVAFSQSKTDLHLEKKNDILGSYSQTHCVCPLVCPVLSMGMYRTLCFNTSQVSAGHLFPGTGQASRFSKILKRVLDENWDYVSRLGYIQKEIGTHSIRKGAVSYLSAIPGGPQDTAICIRAGWTKGKVKDIYMRYISNGDQFVGRCLCLLLLLREDFAVSPPLFLSEEFDWIEPTREMQFPMVVDVDNFRKMT
jgi:hypothetical protein